MSGKNPRLNPLASRKQLLIAESELNRAQLVQDWQAVADEAQAVADRARTLGSVVSTTASLVAGLVSFRRKKSAPAAAKPSWWQTILKGAELISTVWQVFRPQGRGRDGT
jgi:hypothetical protein